MLKQFLEKLGLNGYDDLTKEEKEVYQQYQEVLSKQVTIDDVKSFVGSQIETILNSLADYDNKPTKDIYLKARLRDMMMIKALLDSPEKARDNLRNVIKNLYEPKA